MPEWEHTRYRRLWWTAGFTTLAGLHPFRIRQQPPKDYANVNYLGVTWSYHPRWNEGLVQWTTKDPRNWGNTSGIATSRNYHSSCEQGSNWCPSRNVNQKSGTVIGLGRRLSCTTWTLLTRAPKELLGAKFHTIKYMWWQSKWRKLHSENKVP